MPRAHLVARTDIRRSIQNKAASARVVTKLTEHDTALDALEALGNGIVTERVPVRCATTAAITLASVGLAATDGVTIIDGDRVLVWKQTTASENGIYVAHATAWTRATDANTSAKVVSGISAYICEGTLYGGKYFRLTTINPITLGSTSLTFAVLAGVLYPGVNGQSIAVGAPSAPSATGVIGFIHQDIAITVADGATASIDVTVDATYGKFTVTSVTCLKDTSAGGGDGTIQVKNGTTNAITEAIAIGAAAANARVTAATIVSTYAVITSAAVLRVTRTKTTGTVGCTVLVSGYRTA